MWWMELADLFFLVFHAGWTLFNLFGWMWKKTRRLNLWTLVLTGISWFVLGIFYGMGYCPLTDWHFQILAEMGHQDLPVSYIEYVLDRATGLDMDARSVDVVTVAGFFACLSVSVYLNIRDYRRS